jgi:YHS domain-containing protein
MKKILLISSIIVAAGIAAWYFFFKEPVFKATNGFLVNVNEKGVIIEGYDAVAYFTDNKAEKGDPKFTAQYNGGIYWFTTAEHAALFKNDPLKYAPQYGAFCGYAVSIGKLRPVNPEIYQIENGRLILQHTKEAYDLFNEDLRKSIGKADMKWPGLVESHVGKPVQYDKAASAPAASVN